MSNVSLSDYEIQRLKKNKSMHERFRFSGVEESEGFEQLINDMNIALNQEPQRDFWSALPNFVIPVDERRVGILGGMGQAAGNALCERITKFTTDKDKYGVKGNHDFIPFYHASYPIDAAVLESQEVFDVHRPKLMQEVFHFYRLQCRCWVMPCNTVHGLLGDMADWPPVPFISMIDAVVDSVVESYSGRIGVVGSKTTLDSNLYRDPLERAGREVVYPNPADVDLLVTIIQGVLAGESFDLLAPKFDGVLDRLFHKGADSIILGCTELPLLKPYIKVDSSSFVDCLDVLAMRVCEEVYGTQRH